MIDLQDDHLVHRDEKETKPKPDPQEEVLTNDIEKNPPRLQKRSVRELKRSMKHLRKRMRLKAKREQRKQIKTSTETRDLLETKIVQDTSFLTWANSAFRLASTRITFASNHGMIVYINRLEPCRLLVTLQ